MSYRSGPDSMMASNVPVYGWPGSQVVSPETRVMVPTRTSLAVQGGLPPTFSLTHMLPVDCATTAVEARAKPISSKGIIRKPVKSDFRVNFDGFCPAVLSRLRDSVQWEFVCPVQQPVVESVFISFILGNTYHDPCRRLDDRNHPQRDRDKHP